MAFFATSQSVDSLTDGRVILRSPTLADYEDWAELRQASRAFLQPWEPSWPVDDLTRTSYRRRMRRYTEDQRSDHAFPYFVFLTEGALLGGLTLSNVRRGVAQTATLGYWMGKPFAGKGLMTAAVRLIVPHALTTLGLHRVEAACMPSNAASIRLLEKVGFTREGYARRYLCIDGLWQDHLLFAFVRGDSLK